MLRLRSPRRRSSPKGSEAVLDLGDGKSPQRRRADARKAHYEHQRRLLEVKDLEQLITSLNPGELQKSAP